MRREREREKTGRETRNERTDPTARGKGDGIVPAAQTRTHALHTHAFDNERLRETVPGGLLSLGKHNLYPLEWNFFLSLASRILSRRPATGTAPGLCPAR